MARSGTQVGYFLIEGYDSFVGYPYFSKYSVSVAEEGDKFVVKIR